MSKPFQVASVSVKKILISLSSICTPFLGLDEYQPHMDAMRLERTVPLLELGHLKKMSIFFLVLDCQGVRFS